MKVTYYDHEWVIVRNQKSKINKLPKGSNVYMITVKKNIDSEREIIYIGVTKHLYWRIKTHEMLRLLRRNLKGYIVEVLYRDFGGWVNSNWERKLIWHFKPPFNGTWDKSRNKERHLFWERCGVDKVVYVINPYKNR